MRLLDQYLLSDSDELKTFRQHTNELMSALDITPSQVAMRIFKQRSSFFSGSEFSFLTNG